MNKRMVTHLIGLGLVGLSATGWAQKLRVETDSRGDLSAHEQQREAGKTVAGYESYGATFADMHMDASEFVPTAEFRLTTELYPDEVMVVSNGPETVKEFIEKYNSQLLDGVMVGYSDENYIMFALKDGKAATFLEARGFKENSLLKFGALCEYHNISYAITTSAVQLEQAMKARPDVVIPIFDMGAKKVIVADTADKNGYTLGTIDSIGRIVFVKRSVSKDLQKAIEEGILKKTQYLIEQSAR